MLNNVVLCQRLYFTILYQILNQNVHFTKRFQKRWTEGGTSHSVGLFLGSFSIRVLFLVSASVFFFIQYPILFLSILTRSTISSSLATVLIVFVFNFPSYPPLSAPYLFLSLTPFYTFSVFVFFSNILSISLFFSFSVSPVDCFFSKSVLQRVVLFEVFSMKFKLTISSILWFLLFKL